MKRGENHNGKGKKEKTAPISETESGLTPESQESTPSTPEKITFLAATLPPRRIRHKHDWFFSRKISAQKFISRCTSCGKQKVTTQVNAGLQIVEITGAKPRRIRVNGNG